MVICRDLPILSSTSIQNLPFLLKLVTTTYLSPKACSEQGPDSLKGRSTNNPLDKIPEFCFMLKSYACRLRLICKVGVLQDLATSQVQEKHQEKYQTI